MCIRDRIREDETNKNFSTSIINVSKNAEVVKDFLTAFILMNEDIDLNAARQKMQKMANSYSSGEYSDILETGNYKVYFRPVDSFSSELWFRDVNNKEEIDQSEYLPIDYKAACAREMNKGAQFYFSGKVLEKRTSYLGSSPRNIASIIVLADDGHKYQVIYDYEDSPIVGKTYEFYTSLYDMGETEFPVLMTATNLR